jgi:hypothetical protein
MRHHGRHAIQGAAQDDHHEAFLGIGLRQRHAARPDRNGGGEAQQGGSAAEGEVHFCGIHLTRKKDFFFEKKKQKTFMSPALPRCRPDPVSLP